MKKLVILGFGGYGRTIEDVVLSAQLFDEVVFLDDNARHTKVKGPLADFEKFAGENVWFYPAFGNNNLRVEWMNMIINSGAQIATIIHPDAYVSKTAVVENGTAVLPKAVVNTGSVVRSGCIVNFGAVVDHDVTIEKVVHLCINCVVKANNRISPFAKVEAGQVIQNNTYR